MPKTIEEAIEISLERIKNEEATVEDCVRDFPQYHNELREMLPLVVSLKSLEQIKPSQTFSQNAGLRLVSKLPDKPVTFWESIRHIFAQRQMKPKWRLRMSQIFISLLMAISLLVGGPVAVDAAGPGDLLFILDQALEQAQLNNISDPQEGVILRMAQATERLSEASAKFDKGKIDNALTALELYDALMNDLEEYIIRESGLNREEVRSMVQEELALQAGILDRVRFSWPEDAQARNAYQKALQRSNMGVDTLLGPPEIAPQGPPENVPQGPTGEDAVGPSEEVPMGLKEEAPQGPNEEAPHGMNEEVPLGPNNDETPHSPSKDAPYNPKEGMPKGSTEEAPRGND